MASGEVYVDDAKRIVYWNNMTGSVRIPMANNGRLLFMEYYQQTQAQYDAWCYKRSSRDLQLSCPFLNQIVIPSITVATYEMQMGKHKYTVEFDRDLKDKTAPAISLTYIKEILDTRKDIVCEMDQWIR